MPYWNLHYHVVWGTRNSLTLIDSAWENDLYLFIWKRAVTLDCVPHAIGGMPDHIHVVISIPRRLSTASLILQLKLASSHYVNEQHTNGSFMWQANHRVLSLSELSLPAIVSYVHNQKKHHAENTLNRNMETTALPAFG